MLSHGSSLWHYTITSTDISERPADLRGAKNAIANITINDITPEKKKSKDLKTPEKNDEESYHFIGYVPAFGKVWELVCNMPDKSERYSDITA